MHSIGIEDPAEALQRATTDLIRAAAVIDGLCEVGRPAIELLEASRATHNALVLVAEWVNGAEQEGQSARASG